MKSRSNPNVAPEDLQKELGNADPNTRVNLQQLLETWPATFRPITIHPLLMKAAEHMAIRFALERYQKGEVKVNAVHQMMEHMSRQMDTLRQILRVQEDKMSKAGMLVESHADILDRMFWAEVPEAGKKSVLTFERSALRATAQRAPVRGSAAGTRRQGSGRRHSAELLRAASTRRMPSHAARLPPASRS